MIVSVEDLERRIESGLEYYRTIPHTEVALRRKQEQHIKHLATLYREKTGRYYVIKAKDKLDDNK